MRIQSEAEYESALKRIDELWGAKPDTVEGQELDTLFLAVETYEDEHYPMDEPTSYAAIEFHLDRLDLSIDELPVTQADKETLRTCIANRRAVPEALVIRISNILEIPRDVLGSSDLADADPAPLHTTRITR